MKGIRMKRIKIGGVVVILVFLVLGVAATKKEASYRTKSDAFFAQLMETKISAGYDILLAGSPIKNKSTTIEGLREKTSQALIQSGKPVEIEFIKEQKFGKSMVRLIYIMKFEEVPLIWELYFYQPKPDSDWNLINLRFDVEPDMVGDK
jgi:hypothetical protein